MNKYLSVDPGKINGYAFFDPQGKCTYVGQGRKDEIFRAVDKAKHLEVIICENFRLRPDKSKQQSWSELETVRMIGALEYAAHLKGALFVTQDASIKPIAYKRAGLTVSKNHGESHQGDAYVHGIHYLIQTGVIDPVSLMKGETSGT